MRASLADRFRAKVRINEATGCWDWTGAVSSAAYGTLRGEGRPWRMLKAHRVSYEMHRGPIAEGMVIDHVCRNKLCVNPAHLEPVTGKENSSRYAATVTHCLSGHPFSPENTLVRSRGERACRECNRAHYRRWYAERGGREHRKAKRELCVFEGSST